MGNWGDEERTRELMEFLVLPASKMRERKFLVHGVRYPEQSRKTLEDAGIEFADIYPT